MKKTVICICIAMMAACGENSSSMTRADLEIAESLCSERGGLKTVNVSKSPETETCGSRCRRRTGRTAVDLTALCKDESTLNLKESRDN